MRLEVWTLLAKVQHRKTVHHLFKFFFSSISCRREYKLVDVLDESGNFTFVSRTKIMYWLGDMAGLCLLMINIMVKKIVMDTVVDLVVDEIAVGFQEKEPGVAQIVGRVIRFVIDVGAHLGDLQVVPIMLLLHCRIQH